MTMTFLFDWFCQGVRFFEEDVTVLVTIALLKTELEERSHRVSSVGKATVL
jgi:hypothetical protein